MTELLTAPDVARLLSIKLVTVRAWTSQRRLPHVKLGRAVRYRPEDIDRLIEEARRG